MSTVEVDAAVTVNALQSRLSELQNLWQTAQRPPSAPETRHGADTPVKAAPRQRPAPPVAPLSFCPTKPVTPSTRSPRAFHSRTRSCEDATQISPTREAAAAAAAAGSTALTPHAPPTPSTGTPRARLAAMQPSSSEHLLGDFLTLPPLQTHATALAACPQCGGKLVSVLSRLCPQCGQQLREA